MTTFSGLYAVSFKKIDFGGWSLSRGRLGGRKSVQWTLCIKKSIYESSLSIITVHNFDCIKSRIPAEVVSCSSEISGILLETTRIPVGFQ